MFGASPCHVLIEANIAATCCIFTPEAAMLKEIFGDLRERNSSIIISYFSLRQLIGWLGGLLPLICVVGGLVFSRLPVQPSISSYYHTNMRDFFVGLMICVSIFLITYKGYERIDKLITTIIGIAGFGLAVFPCLNSSASTQPVGIFQISPHISGIIHVGCALIFFILLGLNSIFLFTLGKDSLKNGLYKVCGYIILISIFILVITSLTIDSELVDKIRIILILESFMLWAFGFSWLVKGNALEAMAGMSRVVKEKTLEYLTGLSRLLKGESVK